MRAFTKTLLATTCLTLLAPMAGWAQDTVSEAGPEAAEETAVAQSPETAPGDTPPAPGLPTPNEIIKSVDDGLKILRKGDAKQAKVILEAANDTTFEHDYPSLSKHYPNLGLAYLYAEEKDWSEVLRFSTSVITGLLADGHKEHAYRIQASALLGLALHFLDRNQEAEATLRNTLVAAEGREELIPTYGLALFALARTASWEDLPDEVELRQRFLDEYDSRWLVSINDALHINYLQIEDSQDRDVPIEVLIPQMRKLVKLAETVPEVDAKRTVFYKGYLATLLAYDGEFEAALPLLRQQREYYRDAKLTGPDVWRNVRNLGAVISYAETVQNAYDFFAEELTYAREHGANAFNLALYQREMGHLAKRLSDTDRAQAHYRDAYVTARRAFRANSELVQHLRGFIDINHPDMQGFDFAPELGALEAVEFDLAQDGNGVVRLFFEGNYLALEALLTRFEQNGDGDSVAYKINAALYRAMKGDFDLALETLDEARKLARTTTDAGIDANALIFDQIDVIAKVWGSGHQPETAQGALDRMRARLSSMSESEKSLYYALLAFKHFRTGDLIEMRGVLKTWFALYDAARPAGVWDIYAATMIMEMSFGNMEEALNNDLMAQTLHHLERYPTMSLSRDYLRLVKVLNSRTGVFSDLAMVELGTLAKTIGAAVPYNHSMLAATQFALSNAHGWRGNNEEALEWMRRTAKTLRGSKYARSDVHAFLLARQSDFMRLLGRVNEAHALAQEAYQGFDARQARSDLIASVYQSVALALWERSEDTRQVAAFLDEVLGTPEIYDRMDTFGRVALLRIKGDAEANFADLDTVLATLDKARFEMDNDIGPNDWRLERSNLFWSRAIANYWNGRPGDGFGDILASNDTYTDWESTIKAGGGGEGINPGAFKERADWEALIGWDYAQTLPPDPPE